MGSRVPPTETFGRQNEETKRRERDVRDALRIDGSQFVRLFEKMQALIANLNTTVLDAVSLALAGVINPGGVSTAGDIGAVNVSASANVTATGQVISTGPLKSPGSHAYVVSTGYVGAWINDDGTIGRSPSTQKLKKNLSPMDEVAPSGISAADALMTLVPYWGHYVWDDDGAPLKSFLLAEAVHEAGFGPDVAPLGEDGEPFTVNYSQLVPALIAALQAEAQRGRDRDHLIAALTARLDAAGL